MHDSTDASSRSIGSLYFSTATPTVRPNHNGSTTSFVTLKWIFGFAFVLEVVTCILRFGFHLQSTKDTASTIGKFTFGIRIHHGYIGLLMIILEKRHRMNLQNYYYNYIFQQPQSRQQQFTDEEEENVDEEEQEQKSTTVGRLAHASPSSSDHPDVAYPPISSYDTDPAYWRWWWIRVIGWALIISDLIHHFLVLWPITGNPQFDFVYPSPNKMETKN